MATLNNIMDYLADAFGATYNEITPTHGTSYTSWGGCGYWKIGNIVIAHFALSNVTTSSFKVVYTFQESLRPKHQMHMVGGAQTAQTFSTWNIDTAGNVTAWTPNGYANVTLIWVIEN